MSETTTNAISERPDRAAAGQRLKRSIGMGATVLTVLTMVANGANYASNLIFSRMLQPVGYGELVALLALALVIAIPSGAAQTMIAERVAFYRAESKHDALLYLVRHSIAHVTVIAVVVGTAYVVAIPLVADVLNLPDLGPAIALAPLVMLLFIQPVALGVLQGMDRFIALGLMLVAIALSRIVFGVPWALAGGGSGGVIAGQAIGIFVVLAVSAWLLRAYLIPRGSGAARSGLKRKPNVRTVSASAAFIAFAVLGNLDILLAKVFMNPFDVGLYAAISMVGKVVLFAPVAISFVMVPHAARERRAHGAGGHSLRFSALIVGAVSLVVILPAAIAPELFVKLMFGAKYAAAAAGVRPILVAGAGLALLYLVAVYSVTINDRRWFSVLVAGVALQITGISLFHSSPAQVATVQAAVVIVVLFLNEYWFHSIIWPWRRGGIK